MWLHRLLVPQPGIEHRILAVRGLSPNQTTGLPGSACFLVLCVCVCVCVCVNFCYIYRRTLPVCKYDVNGIISWNVCVVHMISKVNSLKELNTCYLLAQGLSWGSNQAFVWLGNLWRLSLLNLSSLTWLYSWSLSFSFCGPLQRASLVEAAVFSQNEWFRKALAPMIKCRVFVQRLHIFTSVFA